MAQDPLQIISQDAGATAQFFSSVNNVIAQTAANEINLAKTASSIIDTTVKARELKRVNDQQIRSSIIRDEIAQRNSQMQEALFQQEIQMAPVKMQIQELQLQREQLLLSQAQDAERKASFAEFEKVANPNITNDAFSTLYSSNDPSALQAYADIRSRAYQGILSGEFDGPSAAQYVAKEYNKFKEGYIPETKEYNPATTALIAEVIGGEVGKRYAEEYDFEYNPNKQALKNSYRASLIQGTESDHRKLLEETKDPKEKARIEEALFKYKAEESNQEALTKFLEKYTDILGRPLTANTGASKDLRTPEGSVWTSVPAEQKRDFINEIKDQIRESASRQQRILNSVRSGSDVPDFFKPEPEEDTGYVTGASGQSSSNIRPLSLSSQPTKEEVEKEIGNIEGIRTPSTEESIRNLNPKKSDNVASQASVKRVAEKHGLEKILKGIEVEEVGFLGNRIDLESLSQDIYINIRNLSEEDLTKTLTRGVKDSTVGLIESLGEKNSVIAKFLRDPDPNMTRSVKIAIADELAREIAQEYKKTQ